MRAVVTLGLCLAGSAAPAAAAPAVADQSWTGTMRCDVIPHATTKPLVERVTVEVRGGVASMQRDVFLPDTAISSGFHERVDGPVAADGRVTLSGQGYSRTSGYSAEYRGILPQAGGTARLDGVQHWHFARLPPADRPCSLTLHRP